MDNDFDEKRRELLKTVYNLTQGDCRKTAKMSDIGALLGLDRNRTEDVAMDLVGDGLLEIKSLSGALSLTAAGLEQAGDVAPGASETMNPDECLAMVERDLPSWPLNSADRKNLEIDLATFKLQQQRSKPLSGVRKAVLDEIINVLKTLDGVDHILAGLSSLVDAL